jgi:hypothetical protein
VPPLIAAPEPPLPPELPPRPPPALPPEALLPFSSEPPPLQPSDSAAIKTGAMNGTSDDFPAGTVTSGETTLLARFFRLPA